MKRRSVLTGLAAILTIPVVLRAESRVPRIGVILWGGTYTAAVDGLRQGLKELGFIEGTHFTFDIRDANGDRAAIAPAARSLEAENVALIYTITTGITLTAARNTKRVPIVFYAGSDPEAFGIVENFGKPGGRLTGVHGQSAEVVGKRLQLLIEISPRIRRILMFFNPDIQVIQRQLALTRDAARWMKVEIVERPVRSVEQLHAGLRALRPGDADAIFESLDSVVISRGKWLIEAAKAHGMPTMFADRESVVFGALAGYGTSYYEAARLSARHVRAVVLGAHPGQVPVEHYDRIGFFINLKTAKALGLAIPESILAQATEVIE